LLNLLSNAVKFTANGGRISAWVRDSQKSNSVELCVTDTGVGVPPDKIQAIFDPFVQLSTSPSSRHEGTGLGLAISRDLARGMGGDLFVESEAGKGATFVIVLPLANLAS
jgi:signal transduction histidine kinase